MSQESLVLRMRTFAISSHSKKNTKFHPKHVNETSRCEFMADSDSFFLWLILVLNVVHLIPPCLVNVSHAFTVNFVCRDFGFIPGFTCSTFLCQGNFLAPKFKEKEMDIIIETPSIA